MKIIDLLNKIANGEAPKKIKYEYSIYELTPERNDYYCKKEMSWFTNEINSLGVLNDEVEIIEEPKKIEKIKTTLEDYDLPSNNEFKIIDKINELIDEINNLKEK